MYDGKFSHLLDEKLTMLITMDFFPNKLNEHTRLLWSSDYMLLHPLPLSLLWLRIIRVYNSKLLFLYVCIKYKLFQCAPKQLPSPFSLMHSGGFNSSVSTQITINKCRYLSRECKNIQCIGRKSILVEPDIKVRGPWPDP